MNTSLDKLTKELTEKVSKDIDEFIVTKIVELFHTGVLSLSFEKPEYETQPRYPIGDHVTFRHNQKVWLRYKGDELIEKQSTQIALGKFRMCRLIWLLEQSVFIDTDESDGYKDITDYIEDRMKDIKEAELWIEESK